MAINSLQRKQAWWILVICILIAAIAFGYPLYVIRPFRAQGTQELAIALWLRRWGPYFALAAMLTGIFSTFQLWRTSEWRPRILATLAAALLPGLTAQNHLNIFERMFHPIAQVEVLAASQSKFDREDMVLAVKVSGHARAYPIRTMGYHHIVNDWVGRVPLVGTY